MKSITLPELPKDISPEIKEQKYMKCEIEKPELHSVEKVGERLMKYQKCSETGFEKYYEVESKNEDEDFEDDSDYEEETPELLKLNPYNWKSQDHYAVLGLSKLRINATDEDIKKAYRKKVLRHHPDKKASDGNTNNDSFFKCIQKAYEIITDPVKRRQFDSVDPEFDDSIPTKCSKENFFEVLTPVFERNARFSNIQPVPSLGDMNSTREEVEEFYRFWANFDSWRSFEYLDEEDADSYENREDRRYFERKNKNARAKHKKEDNQRIINLIDLAVRTDPRLALFKKADREAKEAKRLEKKASQIAAANEEKKRKEEEEKAKERAIQEEQERIAREKKEKEMKKRVIRKEKKTLKKFLQDNNYLIDPATQATPEQIESQLKKLDSYVSQMDADNLTAYRVYLLRAYENSWKSASDYFEEEHLNEGEKYAAELAAMAPAPVEEIKEEVKEEQVKEPVIEEKKEVENEKKEVVEEKKESEVKPAVAKLLKKLPSISKIGGMRRIKKKIVRKEYDSESENERELEKEKEEAAPATASKKKNKKKKKSKKKNSSEELKVTPADEVKEEITAPINEPITEEVKNEAEASVEEIKEEVAAPVEETAVVEEVKEEIVAPVEEPVVVEEVKEEIAAPIEEPVVEEVKEEIVAPVEEPVVVEEVKEEKAAPIEEPVVVEEVKEEIAAPVEEPAVVEEVKKEVPIETEPETKKSKKIKKKKSRAKIEVKPEEEKKEEKKEIKKEEKKPEIQVKPKEEILKEVKKQEEENAKRIKDILKKKISMGKLRTKRSSKKLREEKREEEKKKEEQKEELTISIKDDNRKKTKAERKAEKAAKKAAKKTVEEPVAEEVKEDKEVKEETVAPVEEPVVVEEVKEETVAPVEEPVVVEEVKEDKKEVPTPVEEKVTVKGMYSVKPIYGEVPEIDTKTKMYTVKSIYGDNVIVDLPLTASQRLNGIEEIKEEVVAVEEPVVVEEPVIAEDIKEEVVTPVEEKINVKGMYTVKPVYGEVPEIDTKTKMYTVKSIYGDNVIVDLPLTASQRLNGIENVTEPEKVEEKIEVTEDKTEVEEKIEIVNEVTEDKTEVEEKTEITEVTSEIEEKTEIIEAPATEIVEEKIEVETITVNEPVKKEEKPVKTLKHCPSGISLKPWTPEQQTKLEEALQKFPSVQFKENPMDRWIEISNYVGRSRTDIKFRIKDLAETIRRKRSIQSLKGEN